MSSGARMIQAASGVRWDRVGRVALLVVLAIVLVLYVRPLITWVGTWQQSGVKREEVKRLETQRARLLERRRELNSPAVLEREARRLGMVRPGERPYIVTGLPRERRDR